MNGMPLISIIIPVYNTEKYLIRCIESVINQTYKNLQIILINDGSTDSSGTICNDYAKIDKRIQVIHQENSGVSSARNYGIDVALGEWIGFVDSDDWIDCEMYLSLLTVATLSGRQIATCGYIIHHLNGWVEYRTLETLNQSLNRIQSLEFLLSQYYYEGLMCNKLFNKSIFDSGIRLDEAIFFCEDLLLVTNALLMLDGICCISKAHYHYCFREDNATRLFNSRRLTEFKARQQIISIVTPVSKKLERLAKVYYANSAIETLYLASKMQSREYIKMLKGEAFRYFFWYMLSCEISVRQKFRNLIIIIFPNLSAKIWDILKSSFKLSWWYAKNKQ